MKNQLLSGSKQNRAVHITFAFVYKKISGIKISSEALFIPEQFLEKRVNRFLASVSIIRFF